jgi:galactoside O-acetyltransferase
MNSFYSEKELPEIGFHSYGKNVLISRFARFYSPEKIKIGDNVRIDDFCILSGNISIGSHIHISAYVGMYAANGIVMEDYSGISPRGTLFSAMDDFNGDYLIGPVHPTKLTNVTGGNIILKKFAQIGANSIVFPNLIIGEGAVVGACSLVTSSLSDWGIFVGVPAKWQKERSKKIKNLI